MNHSKKADQDGKAEDIGQGSQGFDGQADLKCEFFPWPAP